MDKAYSDDVVRVSVNESGIAVYSEANAVVKVYTADGSLVAKGVTNKRIAVPGNGVYVVKANGNVVKVVK